METLQWATEVPKAAKLSRKEVDMVAMGLLLPWRCRTVPRSSWRSYIITIKTVSMAIRSCLNSRCSSRFSDGQLIQLISHSRINRHLRRLILLNPWRWPAGTLKRPAKVVTVEVIATLSRPRATIEQPNRLNTASIAPHSTSSANRLIHTLISIMSRNLWHWTGTNRVARARQVT